MSKTKRRKKPLTHAMWLVLRNIACGYPPGNHLRGRSEFGGLHKTLFALQCRALISYRGEITAKGREFYERERHKR